MFYFHFFCLQGIPHYLSFYSSWDGSRKILSNSPKSGRGVFAPSSITKYQSRRLYLLQWNKNVGKRRQPPVENRKKIVILSVKGHEFCSRYFSSFNFSCFYLLSLWKEFLRHLHMSFSSSFFVHSLQREATFNVFAFTFITRLIASLWKWFLKMLILFCFQQFASIRNW